MAIASHHAVAEAGVAEAFDLVPGQRVMAVIRLHSEADSFVLSDIMVAISGRLADYKLLFSVAALPRNAKGKLDRPPLAVLAADRSRPVLEQPAVETLRVAAAR